MVVNIKQPEKYIWDMLDCCRFVLELKADRTIEDYKRDRLFRSAVKQELIMIGGGMARLNALNPAAATSFTESSRIMELREHLIHRYFDIDAIGVWQFLTEKLPILQRELEAALENAAKVSDGTC